MVYQGNCHCQRIKFTVEGDISHLMDCNCSICQRRGHVLWFVPRAQLKLETSKENLSTYQFNKKMIQHHFCGTCGCAPFGEGVNPKDGALMAAVNVRCLEGVDLSKYEITHFDGKNLL